MEPRIQYVKTSDGVSIAYWTVGQGGPPLIHMTAGFTSSQRQWQMTEGRHFIEGLAERRMVVRYDCRGVGFSQRHLSDHSLDAHVRDLEAVVGCLGQHRCALMASIFSVPVALTYAARHPEHVSHLVLWRGYARATDFFTSDAIRAVLGVAKGDWQTFTEIFGRQGMGGWGAEHEERGRRYAAAIRESAEPEDYVAAVEHALTVDVSTLLPLITSPALVLHRRESPPGVTNGMRTLVSELASVQLVVVEGNEAEPYAGDAEAILGAIREFLGEDAAAAPIQASLVTILFTDLVSSTPLTRRLGDAQAQEVVRAHNAVVREALSAHRGTEIKHTGDGIMASFPTASGALECAAAIQRAVAARADENLQVHIGLNAGEPVAEEADLFGTSVQLARRICDHAAAQQILVSDVVRQLAAGKRFLFSDVGEVVPKGFDEAVRLYELRWSD